LSASPNIRVIKSRMRWVGYVTHGRDENVYKIFYGKPEGKRPLRRSRHRWQDNTGLDLREIGWEVVDWMHMVQDRYQWWPLVNMILNLCTCMKG